MELVDQAPGWNAIVLALNALYGTREPLRYDAMIPHRLGGPDPLDGISVFKAEAPRTHWHFVTFGFSELYDKESKDPDKSGWGYELTFRLACDPGDDQPPEWSLNLLQALARYVFETQSSFKPGQHADFHRPLNAGGERPLSALLFCQDPELGQIETPHGAVLFLQVVGLTPDQSHEADTNHDALLARLSDGNSLLITDLSRGSEPPMMLPETDGQSGIQRRPEAAGRPARASRPAARKASKPVTRAAKGKGSPAAKGKAGAKTGAKPGRAKRAGKG